MLGYEPDLQLVGSQNVADQQIVRTGVAIFICLFGGLPSLAKDDLMRFEQP